MMKTECNKKVLRLQPHGHLKVVVDFGLGVVSSYGGLLLLREVEEQIAVIDAAAKCFSDHRNPLRTKHSILQLVSQRIYSLCLGFEDISDQNILKKDKLLAMVSGKKISSKDEGSEPLLASTSSFHRLEHGATECDPNRPDLKIFYDSEAFKRVFVDVFVKQQEEPEQIILDVDGMHDPLYGNQEGKHYHGYYGCYCYLPLYIFCGDHLLASKLRTSKKEDAHGSLEEIRRVISQIRERWPSVKILIRADSAFCRLPLMEYCESSENVDYILGLPQNKRLNKEVASKMEEAMKTSENSGEAERIFQSFQYKTAKTWKTERRVVAKIEALPKTDQHAAKANHRYIVTSLSEHSAQYLYEKIYCARGDMENRLKEQQMAMFADKLSVKTMRGNQLRLWFSSIAYVLLSALRRHGLAKTKHAKAQAWTIQKDILRVPALIKVSVRRILFQLPTSYIHQSLWRVIHNKLQNTKLAF